MDIPRLRIDLEGVRTSINTMLIQHNDDINKIVIDSLNKQITEDWIQSEIDNAVKIALKKSIEGIATQWELREAISNLIAKSVAKMIERAD